MKQKLIHFLGLKLGYVVFVADFYGKGQIPPDVDGKFAKMADLMEDR